MIRSIGMILLACSPVAIAAQEWPQWRGLTGNGLTDETDLPTEWSDEKNVAWKIPLPGEGWSSPIVWGDKIFVTVAVKEGGANAAPGGPGDQAPQEPRPGGDRPGGPPGQGGRPGGSGMGGDEPPKEDYRLEVHCLDRAMGKTLWTQVARQGRPLIPKHSSNTFATETPVTDGERVYAYFGMHGLYCYDFSGKLLWKKDLGAFTMTMGFGTASSPAYHDGTLFVQVDNEEKSFLVALNAKSGEERWRVSREETTNWGSPIIWKNKARTELVVGGKKTRSYDPATGKVLWELDMRGGRWSASPVADEEVLILGNEPRGRGGDAGGNLFAVRPGASGDISLQGDAMSNSFVMWMVPNGGPPAPSPLIYKGYVYIFQSRGSMVSCYDVKTGKPAYEKVRVEGARAFWASPWAYDGKVFCLDDRGATFVLAAGPEFKVLGQNKLEGQFWATPSFAHGSLLLRGVEALYCVKK